MPNLPTTHKPLSADIAKHVLMSDNDRVYARQANRALPTYCTTWRKLRAYILRKEPLCRTCKASGVITTATHVDHIDGDASTYESNNPENLQALCASCHSIKTAKENNTYNNRGINSDGGYDL